MGWGGERTKTKSILIRYNPHGGEDWEPWNEREERLRKERGDTGETFQPDKDWEIAGEKQMTEQEKKQMQPIDNAEIGQHKGEIIEVAAQNQPS